MFVYFAFYFQTLKYARFKNENMGDLFMSQKRPLQAKASLSLQRHLKTKIMKHTSIMNFFCICKPIYISNIIKSNE